VAANHNFPETGTQQHYNNNNPTVTTPAITISLTGQEALDQVDVRYLGTVETVLGEKRRM
jgi:hypothetical protein